MTHLAKYRYQLQRTLLKSNDPISFSILLDICLYVALPFVTFSVCIFACIFEVAQNSIVV